MLRRLPFYRVAVAELIAYGEWLLLTDRTLQNLKRYALNNYNKLTNKELQHETENRSNSKSTC